MQTFLPYPNFLDSAKVMDIKRLGKQRVEACDILKINVHIVYNTPLYEIDLHENILKNYQNHPAVLMWRGSEYSLYEYAFIFCQVWDSLGHSNKVTLSNLIILEDILFKNNAQYNYPKWLGDYEFHSRHRSILLGKNYNHYKQFNWVEKPAVKVNNKWDYVWPITKDNL